jgi:hypothetical protein
MNNGAGQAGIWDVESASLRYSILDGCPEAHRSNSVAAYTPDGRYVLSSDCNKSYFWDVETGDIYDISKIPLYSKVYRRFTNDGQPHFSPGGRYMISVAKPTTFESVNIGLISGVDMLSGEGFEYGLVLAEEDQVLTGFSFAPKGDRFAVSYSDGSIHILRIVGEGDERVSLSQHLPQQEATPTPVPELFAEVDFEALLIQSSELDPWLRLSTENAPPSSITSVIRNQLKPELLIEQNIRGEYSGFLYLYLFADPANAANAYEKIVTHPDFGSPIEPIEVGEAGSIKQPARNLQSDPYTQIAFYRCNYAVYFKIFQVGADELAAAIDKRLSAAVCEEGN